MQRGLDTAMTMNDKIFQDKTNYTLVFSLFINLILLAVIYHIIYAEMFKDWMNDPNYSHGLLVPAISFYLLWRDKEQFRSIAIAPSFKGLWLFSFGIFMLLAGILSSELFTQRASSIILLMGIVWSWFGVKWLKVAFVPLAFLFFMVLLPYILYDAIAFPLKLLATRIATEALQFFNIMIVSEGNIIYLQDVTLEVADACSGIRSLMSLITLGVVVAYFFLKGRFRQILLVSLAVPIAILTNAMRVIITGFLSDRYGSAVAEGFFHEFSGLIIFATSFALLLGCSYLLSLINKKEAA